ncbi:MAG: lipoate--protein ligase family protein [Candidatus Dormibacteria bacterium]
MPGSPFILVPPVTAPGSTQMEIDCQLLEAVTERYIPGVLRFYRCSPSCITYGRFQNIDDFNTASLYQDGVDLVQRPSGGTAVFHGPGDLTYAFSCPIAHPIFGGSVEESSARIHEVIRSAFDWLGIPTSSVGHMQTTRNRSSDCFAVPGSQEVVDVAGRKLVGSAQTRNATSLLQHGIIPFDPSPISRYLKNDDAPADRSAVNLLAPFVSRDELEAQIANSFAQALGQPCIVSSVLLADTLVP